MERVWDILHFPARFAKSIWTFISTGCLCSPSWLWDSGVQCQMFSTKDSEDMFRDDVLKNLSQAFMFYGLNRHIVLMSFDRTSKSWDSRAPEALWAFLPSWSGSETPSINRMAESGIIYSSGCRMVFNLEYFLDYLRLPYFWNSDILSGNSSCLPSRNADQYCSSPPYIAPDSRIILCSWVGWTLGFSTVFHWIRYYTSIKLRPQLYTHFLPQAY